MKNKLKVILPVLLIIACSLYLVWTRYQMEYATTDYNNLVDEYNSLFTNYQDSIADLETYKSKYDEVSVMYDDLASLYNLQTDELSAYKEIATRSASSSYMDIDIPTIPDDCVGYMYIPTCDVSSFIRLGSTQEAISNYHIGEFEVSEEIGVGNYSVCGHASDTKQMVFSKLLDISIGDPIYVVKNDTLYKFSADFMLDVDPEDTWILENTGTNNPICTIMCCTDSGKRRFVVFGNLVKTKVLEKSESQE